MDTYEAAGFQAAVPVWLAGLEREMNVFAGFKAVVSFIPGEAYTLRVAASSIYRCWVNGRFVGHGPAAAAHGYYRIDEWALNGDSDVAADHSRGAAADTGDSDASAGIDAGGDCRRMVVAIEVAGYNANGYYTLNQPSFVQAEIVGPDRVVVAATGEAAGGTGAACGLVPFEAGELTERLRRTQRYSFQRAFSEAYRLSPAHMQWRMRAEAPFEHPGRLRMMEPKSLLPRGFPYPCFDRLHPVAQVETGTVHYAGPPAVYRKDRSLTGVGPTYLGFREEELDTAPTLALQEYAISQSCTERRDWSPDESVKLGEEAYATFDYGRCAAGFIGAHVACRERTRLYLLFDEVLTDGKVDFLRLQGVNALEYELQPGAYDLESLEPYTLRYLQVLVLEGEAEVSGLFVREYAGSEIGTAAFASSDARLDAIFRAGIQTYRHNAVDAFLDCPSRERAAWLCDSFFTARAAFDLSGGTRSEFHFLENFWLPDRFKALPEGMLPMCYPADHDDGNFIPNWAMWFVLQLEEYGQRSGDEATIRAFAPRVAELASYFERFRNASGLLEKLGGWVFVEWSQANDWIGDVNYPTNMLYAGMLDAAARLYERTEWADQAEQVRQAIREQAYDGRFFVDHAVRADGKLEARPDISEACQYYAFYFGVADPATHAELWRKLRDEFGPLRRGGDDRYPDIPAANPFIGNMLRIECLSAAGETDLIRREWPALFGGMVERTGTLWELDQPIASCDHGLMSHVVRVAYRDFLGIREWDAAGKRVVLRPGAVALEACSGMLPIGEHTLRVGWRWEEGTLVLETGVPQDYAIVVENDSGMAIRRVDSPVA